MTAEEKMLNDLEYRERKRAYRRKYYQEHKEQVKAINEKWRKNNPDKFSQSVYNYRRKRAEELKANGEKYCWMSETERQKRLNKNLQKEENMI